MKKNIFTPIFIFTQLFFIFFYIYQNSYAIKLSYQKQKQEKQISTLRTKKQKLKQELIYLKDKDVIKKFAQEDLNLQLIKLNQIKKLDHDSIS